MSDLRPIQVRSEHTQLCLLGALFLVYASFLLVGSVLAEMQNTATLNSRLTYTGTFRFTSPIIIRVEVRDIERYGNSERSTRIDDLTTASLPSRQEDDRKGIHNRIFEPPALAPFRDRRLHLAEADRKRAIEPLSRTQSTTPQFRPAGATKNHESATASASALENLSRNEPRQRDSEPALLEPSQPIATPRSDLDTAAQDVVFLPTAKPPPHARVRIIPTQPSARPQRSARRRVARQRVARRRAPAQRIRRPARRRPIQKTKKPPVTWVESIHAD
ncbi:MAG: hypothetical protein ACR2PG_21065 [Hyphomicrobiaceae bacterium]